MKSRYVQGVDNGQLLRLQKGLFKSFQQPQVPSHIQNTRNTAPNLQFTNTLGSAYHQGSSNENSSIGLANISIGMNPNNKSQIEKSSEPERYKKRASEEMIELNRAIDILKNEKQQLKLLVNE